MKLSIIIPFLNESENIPILAAALSQFCQENPTLKVEVIFVDDGSKDDSVEQLKSTRHRYYVAKIVKLSKNFGSHAALRAGILNANGDFFTFVYADLQDPLSLIVEMKKRFESEPNLEIVWGTRRQTQNSFFETLFSKNYAKLMRKFVSPDYPPKGFDVVMFTRKVASILNENIESNSSLFLQILTLGFKQAFINYDKVERRIGKSKWTFDKKIKLLIDSFAAFSFAPIRAVTATGITFVIVGGCFATYLIFRKLIYQDLVSGWPMLMSILMLGFGVTNISLGIIAEYLWRTLDAARNRPTFIIDYKVELNHEQN